MVFGEPQRPSSLQKPDTFGCGRRPDQKEQGRDEAKLIQLSFFSLEILDVSIETGKKGSF
jgi:hypothetical protein